MDGFGGQIDTLSTPASMTARVLSDAKRAWGDEVEAPVLERYAHDAVAALWQETIKVRTFVPVLALRQIREMLEVRGEIVGEGETAR